MKFSKQKMTSIEGAPEWRFIEETKEPNLDPFTIIADRAGIRFSGRSETVYDIVQLQALAKVISDAWTAHRKFQPNLTTNSAGH